MMRHPAFWFAAGALSVIAYHKYVKPMPTTATA